MQTQRSPQQPTAAAPTTPIVPLLLPNRAAMHLSHQRKRQNCHLTAAKCRGVTGRYIVLADKEACGGPLAPDAATWWLAISLARPAL